MKPGRTQKRERQQLAPAVERPVLWAPNAQRSPPVQKRSAITRERLEEAALALFGKKGFEGTSIADIATEAGAAVGGFYIYFESKREVLLVLMDRLVGALSGLSLNSKSDEHPQKMLRAFVDQAFSYDLRYLGAYRAWQEAISSDADLRVKDDAVRAWSHRRVKTLLNHFLSLRGARCNVDVDTLAAVLDRLFWSLLGEMLIVSPAEQRKRLRTTADLVYHSIFKDQEDAK